MQILFVTSNRIGDAVLSMGILSHLVATYPNARFTIACGAIAADLFRAVPRLDRLIPMTKKKHHGHWLDLWKACSSQEWDLVVDLRNSLFSRLLKTKRRFIASEKNGDEHKVVQNAKILGLNPPPSPCLWFDEKALAEARLLMPQDETPVLAIAPSANWPTKQWPVFNFLKLIERFVLERNAPMHGAKILLLAAPSERSQLHLLYRYIPERQLIDSVGMNLLSVAACVSLATLFVGNDSGLTHIAAATGIPTVGLFGPGFENVYGPWGDDTAVIRGAENAAILLSRLPYNGASHPNLMTGLSVDAVFDVLFQKEMPLCTQQEHAVA